MEITVKIATENAKNVVQRMFALNAKRDLFLKENVLIFVQMDILGKA